MRTSRHKNIRRRFAVTQLSKNRLDKQNQVALSERLDSVYRIPCYFPCKAKNRPRRAPVAKPTIKLLLACPSTNQALTRSRNGQVSKPTKNRRMFSVGLFVGARSCNTPCLLVIEPSPKIDRATRMWASRHKNIRRRFAVGIFLSVLAVEASVFCAGANHRPRRKVNTFQKGAPCQRVNVPSLNKTAQRLQRRAERKGRQFCRPFAFGLVLSERFFAQTSRIPAAQYPLRS